MPCQKLLIQQRNILQEDRMIRLNPKFIYMIYQYVIISWMRPIGVWSPGNIRPWVWSNDGWMRDPQFHLDTFGASTCPRATIHLITFVLMPLLTVYYIHVSITAWLLFLKGLNEVKSAKDSIPKRYSGSCSCILAHGQRWSTLMALNDL